MKEEDNTIRTRVVRVRVRAVIHGVVLSAFPVFFFLLVCSCGVPLDFGNKCAALASELLAAHQLERRDHKKSGFG